MKKALLFFVISIFYTQGFGQTLKPINSETKKEKAQEKLQVHLNSEKILPGEYLYYSLALVSQTTSAQPPLSQVAYIALVNPKGKIIKVNQIVLEGPNKALAPLLKTQSNIHYGQGALFIPATLPTGAYTLIGYTEQILHHNPKALFVKPIALINPYTNARVGSVKVIHYSEGQTQQTPNSSIIEVQKRVGQRAKINIGPWGQPTANLNIARTTVSIRKKETLISYVKQELPKSVTPLLLSTHAYCNLKTDTKGPQISGKISLVNAQKNLGLSGLDKKLENIGISLAYLGEQMPYKITTTGAGGHFSFPLSGPVNTTNAVITLLTEHPEAYEISLDSYPIPNTKFLPENTLFLAVKDLKNIENRSVYNQIENAYTRFKPDSIPLENRPITDLSGVKSNTYHLQEYTLFPTLGETIFEIINEIVFKKTTSGIPTLFCKGVVQNTPSMAPALVLLDGIPVMDHQRIIPYSSKNIKQVNIIQKQMVLGNQIWNGVIELISHKGIPEAYISKYNLKVWKVQSPELKKTYFRDYGRLAATLPQFNHQLLWLPNQNQTQLKEFKSFFTSSVKGLFELVQYHTLNNGTQTTTVIPFLVE